MLTVPLRRGSLRASGAHVHLEQAAPAGEAHLARGVDRRDRHRPQGAARLARHRPGRRIAQLGAEPLDVGVDPVGGRRPQQPAVVR
jgi:hypothetical protein